MGTDLRYLAILVIPIIGGVIWLSKNDNTDTSRVNPETPITGSLAPRNGSPPQFLTQGFDPNATSELTAEDFDGGRRKRQTKKNKKRKTIKRKTTKRK
jgi:hypothetical protein